MHFEIVDSYEKFLLLENQWTELLFAYPNGTIFQTFGWVRSWYESYGEDKDIRIILGFEKDKIGLIVPLYLDQKAKYKRLYKTYRFLGDIRADYLSIIYEDHRACQWADLLEYMQKTLGASSIYKFFRTPTVNYNENSFFKYLNEHTISCKSDPQNCYGIDFNNPLPKLRNKTLKYSEKKLSQMGKLNYWICPDEITLMDRIDTFFESHIRRWQQTSTPSLFNNKQNIDFYKYLVRILFKHGFIHYSELQLNGRQIAAHFGFIYQDRFYYYKPTYDIDLQKYSPGTLLMMDLIEDMKRRKITYFDFLRGKEGYKLKFSNTETVISSLFYFEGKMAHICKLVKKTKDMLK